MLLQLMLADLLSVEDLTGTSLALLLSTQLLVALLAYLAHECFILRCVFLHHRLEWIACFATLKSA